MANYSDLKLSIPNESIIMAWGDNKIRIKKHLPIADKYDIAMITLQESAEDGYYNPIKLDMFYHLNLVYIYTDLVFTEEERSDPEKLYDELKTSGFLNTFLQYIECYTELKDTIDLIAEMSRQAQLSVISLIKKLIDDLPANVEAVQSIVENFDPEKYQAVIDFAKAANGGRPLPK